MTEVKKTRARRSQAPTPNETLTQNLTTAFQKGQESWGFEDKEVIDAKVAELTQIDTIKYMTPKWVAAAVHIISTHSEAFGKAASEPGGRLPVDIFTESLFKPYLDTFLQTRKSKKSEKLAVLKQRFKFMLISYCQRIFTRIYLKDTIPVVEIDEAPLEENAPKTPEEPTSPEPQEEES
jgi:hypothetical protein